MHILTKLGTVLKAPRTAIFGPPEIVTMRFFDVEVISVQHLSPSFARVGFRGEMVKNMRMFAPDQWIKLYIPNKDGSAVRVKDQAHYNSLPRETRPPVRTYTIRALRPEVNEFDVDFVLHGDEGPASRWALNAEVGNRMQIRAHCLSASDKPAGCRWVPLDSSKKFVLFADETGLPAVVGILEQLAAQNKTPEISVFVEVPSQEDCLTLPEWPGLNVKYLVKDKGQKPGEQLHDEAAKLEFTRPHNDVYVWLAAEKAAVRRIRQYLSEAHELEQDAISFAGYWKYGEKQA